MNDAHRDRFDELVGRVIGALPPGIAAVLEELPVIVLDRPTPEMFADLGIAPADQASAAREICGLHTGVPDTEASYEAPQATGQIHLFREGIVNLCGGWTGPKADEAIAEEIRVTLLHEIGHQMGLDEDDLDALGYA